MKFNNWLLLTVFLISFSCDKEDGLTTKQARALTEVKGANGVSYKESLDKWTELKEKNGTAYSYKTTFVSWAGFGNTTEIRVENGVVTGRIYQAFTINGTDGTREIVDSYTETQTNLGSHDKGAPLLTIDELYQTCAKDYLVVNEKRNTIYFETEADGLMNLCGYVPKDCADDCYRGVRIDAFEWLK